MSQEESDDEEENGEDVMEKEDVATREIDAKLKEEVKDCNVNNMTIGDMEKVLHQTINDKKVISKQKSVQDKESNVSKELSIEMHKRDEIEMNEKEPVKNMINEEDILNASEDATSKRRNLKKACE